MTVRTWLILGVCGLVTGLAVFPWAATAQVPDSVCPPTACGLNPAKRSVSSMLVNSRRIKLNYAINDVGPSGVGTIELWATRDGKSWARYSNEPPPDGPLVVHVAEEGKYGFTIVVRNGVGVASAAPKTGDDPQVWVHVDETRPEVKLGRISVGQGHDAGTLAVEWKATDERLAVKPVTISVSTRKDGPWTPVATSIENTGRYVWHMPRDHPYAFHVKVEAADRAGNVGGDTTHEPIKIDLMRPKGTIIGVDAEKKADSLTVIPTTPVETATKQEFMFGIGWRR
jgi:hypothetical protein